MDQLRREHALNIPNLLTLLRILLLPVVAWLYLKRHAAAALFVYLLAMATDAADGILARRLGEITSLGKLLDPLADKLSLVMLLWLFAADGQIPQWVLLLVLVKEVLLILGGMAALRFGIVVSALPIGKVTTVSFIASMTARFLRQTHLADDLLAVSVVLSMASLVRYSVVVIKMIAKTRADSTK